MARVQRYSAATYLLRDVGEAGCVEAVALRAGSPDEFVEEGNGFLTRVVSILVFNHARLQQKHTSGTHLRIYQSPLTVPLFNFYFKEKKLYS